jgi:hypothetical protein
MALLHVEKGSRKIVVSFQGLYRIQTLKPGMFIPAQKPSRLGSCISTGAGRFLIWEKIKMENKTNRVLNERAFAETVGLSYAKIKQMRQRGQIKGYCRVGRRVIYRNPEHVTMFLKQFEQLESSPEQKEGGKANSFLPTLK